jgi:hypothetical protein
MNFHITTNPRSYQIRFLLDVCFGLVQSKEWPVQNILVTHKGQTDVSNMQEVLSGIFEADKIYDIAGKKVSTGEILAKAEAFDAASGKKKLPKLIEGRHRAVARWLVSTFHGIDIDPNVAEVEGDRARKIMLEGNISNENYAKMLNTEKLSGIVQAIKDGLYPQQTSLPVKRGQQQVLWHRSQAVILQGISCEDACKLSYKEAKAVAEGGATLEAVLAEQTQGKNAKKILPGEKIRDLLKIARNYDPASENYIARLLAAIVDNSETAAKVVVTEYYRNSGAIKAE